MALLLNKPKLDNLAGDMLSVAKEHLLDRAATPAKDLLAEFWKLEKEAEKMLEGLAK